VSERFIDVSTEDIVAELMSRFDDVVFMGRRQHGKDSVELKDYQGDHTTLMGMCAKLNHSIGQSSIENEREEDGF
jgi:hypothetical protein